MGERGREKEARSGEAVHLVSLSRRGFPAHRQHSRLHRPYLGDALPSSRLGDGVGCVFAACVVHVTTVVVASLTIR